MSRIEKGKIIFMTLMMVMLIGTCRGEEEGKVGQGHPGRLLSSDIERLELERREVVHVKASIGAVDYDLLRNDFPFLKAWTRHAIDTWLLKTVAVFRRSQVELAAPRGVHSPLELIEGEMCSTAYTSSLTRRSVYVEIRNPETDEIVGFIDVKGSGTDNPLPLKFHANSIIGLDETFNELIAGRLLQRISEVVVK